MNYFSQLNKQTQQTYVTVPFHKFDQSLIHPPLYITARTIVCIYRFYMKAPEDGPLQSETCTAET